MARTHIHRSGGNREVSIHIQRPGQSHHAVACFVHNHMMETRSARSERLRQTAGELMR
ncbi:MAG: hypothetical protein KCHDKBKB_02015 [Elusimicrobia bacterium]|nr:hypothetical protein [Elusimicrobiota bacterium]